MYKVHITPEINSLCYQINGICMKIHSEVGPGLPERFYQKALEYVFVQENVDFQSQCPIPIMYRNVRLGTNYLDFLINERLIVEIKSVNMLTNVHLFQVLKYLGYTGMEVALLINFGKERLEHKRVLATQKMLKSRQGDLKGLK